MKRQPEGIPAGGQFATEHKPEPTSSLPPTPPVFGTDFESGVRDALGEVSSSYAQKFLRHAEKLTDLGYTHEDFAHSYGGASTIAEHDISPERFHAGRMFFSTEDFSNLPSLMREHALNASIEQLRRGIPDQPIPQDKDSVAIALESAHDLPAEQYAAALDEQLPFLGGEWKEALMSNHTLQPKTWALREVRKASVANERLYAATLARTEASPDYPFTTHPVTELERDIDQALLHDVDVDVDDLPESFKKSSGEGYGTLNIRAVAHTRKAARRSQVHPSQVEGVQE